MSECYVRCVVPAQDVWVNLMAGSHPKICSLQHRQLSAVGKMPMSMLEKNTKGLRLFAGFC